MKVPGQNERLKQTRERLEKMVDAAAQKHIRDKNIPVDLDSPTERKNRQTVVDYLVQAFDENGFFVAYVGD